MTETASEREELRAQHSEMMEELRAVIPGAEVLFAFLLTASFSDRFDELNERQRATYLFVFLAAGLALALLLAPSVFHRVRFRRDDKEAMLRIGNREALAALIVMTFSIPAAVLLVTDVLHGLAWGLVAGSTTLVVISFVWWSIPLRRTKSDHRVRSQDAP